MTARVLDYEEWHKCPDYMDAVLMTMKPGTSRICVVENEQGEIVARWLLYPVLFAEDLWVHPDYRKRVSVGRKLWRLVHRAATELGFGHMLVTAMDDEIKTLLAHPSVKAETMPNSMYVFPVQGVS